LLEHGANINAKAQGGYTALMRASSDDSVRGVRYLLEHAADTNLENESGDTALLLLNTNSKENKRANQIADLLLGAGADPCHRNHQGISVAERLWLNSPLRATVENACHAKQPQLLK
jgi:ankyrin repeat protein